MTDQPHHVCNNNDVIEAKLSAAETLLEVTACVFTVQKSTVKVLDQTMRTACSFISSLKGVSHPLTVSVCISES